MGSCIVKVCLARMSNSPLIDSPRSLAQFADSTMPAGKVFCLSGCGASNTGLQWPGAGFRPLAIAVVRLVIFWRLGQTFSLADASSKEIRSVQALNSTTDLLWDIGFY